MAYEKQTWAKGDVVTSAKLNHMEDGIEGGIAETELTVELGDNIYGNAKCICIGDIGVFEFVLGKKNGAMTSSDIIASIIPPSGKKKFNSCYMNIFDTASNEYKAFLSIDQEKISLNPASGVEISANTMVMGQISFILAEKN